jgi:general secretion pathway protein G
MKSQQNRHKMRGFTLIEIMVVVVILGILATIIVPKIISRPEEAKQVKVKQDIQAIQTALDLYKLDNGFYPSTDQGLTALTKEPTTEPVPTHWKTGGYLQNIPLDPWSHPYQYLNPGVHNSEGVDIYSEGSSNKGKKEIGNWEEK